MARIYETERSFKEVVIDLMDVLDTYMLKMIEASGVDMDDMDDEEREMFDMTNKMFDLCAECSAAYVNDIDQIKNDLTEIKALLANK